MEFKNRAERRAYQFKGIKPAAHLAEELLPKVVKAGDDGRIYIPVLPNNYVTIFNYMIPEKDLIEVKNKEVENLLNQWFFGGLQWLKLEVKPECFTKIGDDPEYNIKRYVRGILQSFEPGHNHKMDYLKYVLNLTCNSFTFGVDSAN